MTGEGQTMEDLRQRELETKAQIEDALNLDVIEAQKAALVTKLGVGYEVTEAEGGGFLVRIK